MKKKSTERVTALRERYSEKGLVRHEVIIRPEHKRLVKEFVEALMDGKKEQGK